MSTRSDSDRARALREIVPDGGAAAFEPEWSVATTTNEPREVEGRTGELVSPFDTTPLAEAEAVSAGDDEWGPREVADKPVDLGGSAGGRSAAVPFSVEGTGELVSPFDTTPLAEAEAAASDDRWEPPEDAEEPVDLEASGSGGSRPGPFSVEGELLSWAETLARVPHQVHRALELEKAPLAVRMLVAGGARDENWLTNLVFYARHPNLGGRSIRPDERALANQWLGIRNRLIRPLLHSAPVVPTSQSSAQPPLLVHPDAARRSPLLREWQQKALQSARIDARQWKPSEGFDSNRQIVERVYAYYTWLFNRNENLLWAGMAKLAGGQVYGGLVEAQRYIERARSERRLGVGADLGGRSYLASLDLIAGLADALQVQLLNAQRAIFEDLGWQHQTFVEGGLDALEAARSEIRTLPIDAWRDIGSSDPGWVRRGNRALLRREQEVIVLPYYTAIRGIPDLWDQLPAQMSTLANSPIPGGKPFRAVVPDGDITVFKDRWRWIEADMLPKYEQLTPQRRRQLVNASLTDLAERRWPPG